MICLLWILLKSFLVQAAASSGSAEAAGANRAAMNGGGVPNAAANPIALPGLILPQLVLIQPGPAPNGQVALALAQGPGLSATLPVLQQQAGMVPPHAPAAPAAPAAIVPLFAVLPQANGMSNAQSPILNNGQPIQLVPVPGLNPQHGGGAAGKARIKHSAADWLMVRSAGDFPTVTQGTSIPASAAARR